MSHLELANVDHTVACVVHYLAELINAGAEITQAAGGWRKDAGGDAATHHHHRPTYLPPREYGNCA